MKFRDEKGATLVTVAIALILLLGAAAVALDLAAGWNERRQDQTAADLAAMAGALSFPDHDKMVEEAMATARLNVDTSYTDAEWTAMWQSCTDSYPGFVGITHSTLGYIDCIGLNTAFFRVRVPDQLVDTSFARVIGFNSLTTSAGAVVELLQFAGSGALPFAIRGDADAGTVCLDTGPGGTAEPPCDGPEKGSFGNIAPPLFGLYPLTGPDCSGQGSGENVAAAIAMGIDHILDVFPAADWAALGWAPSDTPSNNTVDAQVNMDECIDEGGDLAAPADGIPIEGVYVDTGNNAKSDATEGLVTGTNFADGLDARLTRIPGKINCAVEANCRNVDGYELDNTPLWSHLIVNGTGIAECQPGLYAGLADTDARNAAMAACLAAFEALALVDREVIFADTILTNNPRLGLAPRLWHNNLGSGTSFRPIRTHDLIYLNGIWLDDKDGTIFFPDLTTTTDINIPKPWKDVEQVTAFLLVDEMVSNYVHDNVGKITPTNLDPTLYE